MLWFGVSVMDDGFVYNIHHSSLTYPSRIQDASFMRKKGNLACQVCLVLEKVDRV